MHRLRITASLLALAVAIAATATGCSSLLYYPTRHEHLNPARLGLYPDRVWFPSEDGYRLHGWYFRNKAKAAPKAVIVFFHGNAQNISTHFGTLLWLLDSPYDYFIFDYRGYGRSEGTPSPKGTVLDGKAAIRWVRHRNRMEGIDGTPIVVFGQSLGGAIAMRSVIDLKGEIPLRLVVADSTFLSYRSVARGILASHWLTWPLQPLAWLLLSDKYAPGDEVAEISPVPLLVIHGRQDQVVGYEQGEEVFAEAREPKEFWTIPDGRHTDAFWKKDPLYRTEFLKVLDRVSAP